jgi:hypothetical protein
MRAVLALLITLGPASAEAWIDYELLFRQHADKVVVTTNSSGEETRTIDFGDGVTVSCSTQGCFGMDQNGAMGCAWMIYSAVLAVAEVCEMPDARTGQIEEMFDLYTGFVARNAVPPRSVAEIESYHQSEVDAYRLGVGDEPPLNCAEVTAAGSDVMMMIDNLTSQGIDLDAAAKALATPRLPVMNPCL